MFRLCLLQLSLLVLVFQMPSFGYHGMGGEITWTCQGNGTFKFKLKHYRDCNGITPPDTIILQTNHPVGTITLNHVQHTDISTLGYKANGDTLCPTCSQGSFQNPISGLVEEYVYESGDVTLTGVPPATGWWFRWGECCRATALTNLVGGGGLSFGYRAYMYSYNNQNTFPCYDSSPYFSEAPATLACTGWPFTYSPQAVDPDADRLLFAWASPIGDNGVNIPLAPGYSVSSQLPDPTQNVSNVAAVLDTLTGSVSATSFTSGYFVTVMSAASYRCGIKIAEVFRDYAFHIVTGCDSLATGPNNAPVVTPPLIDPTTGLQTAFTDTVNPGDTVSFQIAASDLDLFLNNNPQLLTLTGSGAMFGANYTDPQNGCANPPCATLSQSLPYSAPQTVMVNFSWVTDCGHISNVSSTCASIQNVFPFRFTVHDNYCPGNARETFMVTVVIRGASFTVQSSQTVLCITDPPFTLTASPPGGTFWGMVTNGNQFDPSIAGQGTHLVYYTVTDSSGCTTTDALTIQVDACSGIAEGALPNRIKVSPVPADEEITIELPAESEIEALSLFDLQGRKVRAWTINPQASAKLDVSGVAPGVYQLTALSKNTSMGCRIVIF